MSRQIHRSIGPATPRTRRQEPARRHWAWVLLLLVALLFALAACAGGPPVATPTAIPLAATASPTVRPARPGQSASVPGSTPGREAATGTPTPAGSGSSSELDEMLARRTVEDFLARLARGDLASAASLYLTERAKEAGLDKVVSQLAAGDRTLIGAKLLGFGPAPASGYEAQAELQWSGVGPSGPATQAMQLRLAYIRGLWLIDDVILGEPNAQPATATPSAARANPQRRASPALEGRLVFQVRSGGEIYRINADGSGLRRLTDGLDPAWSPDGALVALTRWRNPWGVYLVRPDGRDEERVVDADRLKEVAWAPDGDRIAFTRNPGAGEPTEVCFRGYCFTILPPSSAQIWIADLDSGGLVSLPLDDQVVHSPSWSPDGRRIIYAGERGLAWIDLDSEETGRFPGGSAWDGSPAYSPGGRQVAFMGRVHNRWEIWVMNADGSGRRQLTHSDPRLEDPPQNVAPTWSPDGSRIAFLSDRDGLWRVYVMNADGSEQRPMFGDELDSLGLSYEWASERVLSWSD